MNNVGKLVPLTITIGSIITINTWVNSDIAGLILLMIGITLTLCLFFWLRSLAVGSPNGQSGELKLDDEQMPVRHDQSSQIRRSENE